jgi:hypothetical protein
MYQMCTLISRTILVFKSFSLEAVLGFEKWSVGVKISKFEIWTVQTLLNENVTIIKNVDLNELRKLGI